MVGQLNPWVPKRLPWGFVSCGRQCAAPPFCSIVWRTGTSSQALCTNVQNGSDMALSGAQEGRRAAQMYYLRALATDAIARGLRTSRATVSRLLSSARE